ncbi:MAG: hypothetical protein ACOYD6_06665 [Limnochordia bacterium]
MGRKLVVLCLALLTAGCRFLPSPLPTDTGQVQIQAALTSLSQIDNVEEYTVWAELTAGTQTRTAQLQINKDVAVGRMDKVLAGQWELKVLIKDWEGDIIYQGASTIEVQRDQETVAQVVLEPAPGRLYMHIDLDYFSDQENIRRARIHLSPGDRIEVQRSSGQESLIVETQLPPRTYDFKVELYTSTFHQYNRVHEGFWEEFHIQAGKQTTLLWRPATGAVEIDGDIALIPPPPEKVVALWTESGIRLTWQYPGDTIITGFCIYSRIAPLEPFALVQTLPAGQLELFVPQGSWFSGDEIEFGVTALTSHGIESRRATSNLIQIP